MIFTEKKQGVLMIVGSVLAFAGAGYGFLTDEQVQVIQQATEVLLATL